MPLRDGRLCRLRCEDNFYITSYAKRRFYDDLPGEKVPSCTENESRDNFAAQRWRDVCIICKLFPSVCIVAGFLETV
jgi:hypothetical protein